MIEQVRCVEIEIHSYCNRKCSWCPNVYLDRSQYIEMDEKMYISVLNELEGAGYIGAISYSRYNEPMANIKLLKKRVKQARKMVPGARLVTNTNGDYLSKKNLKGLLIDELTVMDYDCKGEKACTDLLKEVGAKIVAIKYPFIHAMFGDMKIIYNIDWPMTAEIVDRGGLLNSNEQEDVQWLNNKLPRNRPCYEPMHFVGIDYTGDITPCCEIRGDEHTHKPYVLGNLKERSLQNILNGKVAMDFRRFTLGGEFDSYLNPCRNCQKDPGRYTRSNPGIGFVKENDLGNCNDLSSREGEALCP